MNADLAAMEDDPPDPARGRRPRPGRRRRSSARRMRATSARATSSGCDATGAHRPGELEAALARFHELHEQEYGHHFEQSPIELVNLRVTAVAQVPKIRVPPKPARGSLVAARCAPTTPCFGSLGLESFATTFYDRGGCRWVSRSRAPRSCCRPIRRRSCPRIARPKSIHPVPSSSASAVRRDSWFQSIVQRGCRESVS